MDSVVNKTVVLAEWRGVKRKLIRYLHVVSATREATVGDSILTVPDQPGSHGHHIFYRSKRETSPGICKVFAILLATVCPLWYASAGLVTQLILGTCAVLLA